LNTEFIRRVHEAITDQLPHTYDQPGVLRDNSKAIVAHVGDEAYGGRYKPPHYGKDVQLLLDALVEWHGALQEQKVPALIRAPLVHIL
jgi:hypothetical protein